MNYKLIIISSVIAVGIIASLAEKFSSEKEIMPVTQSIYDFKINGLNGQEIDFSTFKGKYVMIVNTASKCSYTPQYTDLQKLNEQYKDQVAILGFPANNFLWQEPGTNHDIEEFCQINYGVTFQMFEKISVKGDDRHPLYTWLESKTGKTPSWNFCKYLIGKDGEVLAYYPSKVSPLDKVIIDRITQ